MILIKNSYPVITQHQQSKEQGFTLVEILVVILIIGILASIAIPAFLNQRKGAVDMGLKSDMKSMAMEIATWELNNKDTITSLPRNPDFGGWTILAQNSPDDAFIGTGDSTTNYAPEGFDLPKVSAGTAMGVLTNPVVSKGGYCIVGNSNGGTYNPDGTPPEGVSKFSYSLTKSLFFDSIAGGLLEPNELSADGACGIYYKRIASGV